MRRWRGSGSTLAARRLEGAVEDRQVLVLQVRGALDRVVLVDVLDDVLRLARSYQSQARGASC
jgi:hypothetical protein